MTRTRTPAIASAIRTALCVSVAAMAAGCALEPRLSKLGIAPVDPNSAVAADVREAERTPGPYPRFSKLPGAVTDLRPAGAWRQAVLSEWAQKVQTDKAVAAIPFTLQNSEAWASQTRARVSADEVHGAPEGSDDRAEAFAKAERARATPPPSPK